MAEAKIAPQFIAGLAAAMGAFAAGTTLGWAAPAQEPMESGYYGYPMDLDEISWTGSLLTLGAAAVCVPIGFLINIIGRKLTMLLLVLPFCIGWTLVWWGGKLFVLYIGRFILGLAGGAFCVCAPMYTTEIAQIQLRGTLGTFFQLFLVIGVTYASTCGAFVELSLLNILCAILPLIFAIVFAFMPESPTYLIMKEKNEAAIKAYKFLRGSEYNADAEIAELKAAVQKSKDNPVSLRIALCRKSALKPLGISIATMFFQQASGINAVVFYSTDLFSGAGSGFPAQYVTILVGVMLVVATFVSAAIVDKAGRRLLLIISAIFMAISTGTLGLYFILLEKNPDSVESISWLPILAVCLYILLFSIGFGPVPWILIGELFADDVKSIAGSISGSTNWLSAFLIVKTFPLLQDLINKGGAFMVYTVVSVIAAVFVFFLLPETKGKTTAEIQKELGGE